MNTIKHTLLIPFLCSISIVRLFYLFILYLFLSFYFSNYLFSDLVYKHVDVWRAKYCQERIKLSSLVIVLFQLRKTEIFQAPD